MMPAKPTPVRGPWRELFVVRRIWWLAKVRQVRRRGYQCAGKTVWTYREFREVWRVSCR
jgi:hypothetical protein